MPDSVLQRIPLPRQSYPLDSTPESAQDLINFFAEVEPSDARSPLILRSTPGLTVFQEFGTGPVRAMSDLHGYLYVVTGDLAYRLIAGQPTQALGQVLGGTEATIAVGPLEVIICTPPNAYIATHDGILSQITNDAFPGASSVAYLDGYFLFTEPDSGRFFISKLTGGGEFEARDFATQEAMPDVVKRGVAHNGLYWLFGADVVEIWVDVGAADFPFRRQPGAVIYGGTTAAASIARMDNSLCWLGRDNIVYQSNGLAAKRISTHALEQALTTYGETGDAQGCSFVVQGHWFYSLSFPTAPDGGKTWVYDAATQLWHKRASGGTGRWRAQTAAQFGQSPVIGDCYSGKVFFLAPDVDSEDGAQVFRRAVFPPIVAEQRRVWMHRFELEMEVGSALVPSQLLLSWSDDGGASFRYPRPLDVGAVNARNTRPFSTRLGSFRQRTMRLDCFGFATIYGADARMEPGPA